MENCFQEEPKKNKAFAIRRKRMSSSSDKVIPINFDFKDDE